MAVFDRIYADSLLDSAQQYLDQGWSVIPVYGASRPDRAKLPTIKWRRYQYQRATADDLERWFRNSETGGLAIVCGSISGLVVLDFDDAALADAFAVELPDLAATRIVLSGGRGLPHYYYRLLPGTKASSRSAPGADLRGDGAYVIAPPTRMNSGTWRLISAREPRTLDKHDLRRILRFLAAIPRQAPQNGSKGHSRAISGLSGQQLQPDETLLTPADLIQCYHRRAGQGRNQALFDVAIMARDQGWTESDVRSSLAAIHAGQTTSRQHKQETLDKRYLEAVRSIASAFSRPARGGFRNSETAPERPKGLPNAIREKLLQIGLAAAARVWDGLCLAGVQAGEILSESSICKQVKAWGIGRRSVIKALAGCLSAGTRLFRIVKNNEVAKDTEKTTNQCGLNRVAKRVKKARGRRPTLYIIPDMGSVASLLGIDIRGSDTLQAEDLRHPAAYRRALQRELIRRRPGQYPRQWLAERLGVSEWTSRRYDQQLEIQVRPMYQEQRVRLSTLAIIPDTQGYTLPGTFLEDERGRRYPPLRTLAQQLLRQGKKVVYKRQVANHYAVDRMAGISVQTALAEAGLTVEVSAPEAHSTTGKRQGFGIPKPPNIGRSGAGPDLRRLRTGIPDPSEKSSALRDDQVVKVDGFGIPKPGEQREPKPAFWLCPHCLNFHIRLTPPPSCSRCGRESPWECIPDSLWQDAESHKQWWQALWHDHHPARKLKRPPRYGQPLPDTAQEGQARRLHDHVPGLSLVNARRLTTTYSANATERGLQQLMRRRNVNNPAGFLVTLLRSEHMFHSKLPSRRSNPTGEDAQTWVQKLAQSPYVSFLANADEFQSSDEPAE